VGYGSTYPALGYENHNPTHCFFINFICSLESLWGVLYSGFCGAILFGKVLRIQSQAQVIFSDPICVRYGTGVIENEQDEETAKFPCPVLEFRIVNRLFNELGGEIMDATLNVVANIDADDSDPTQRNSIEPDRSTSNLSSSNAETASDHSGATSDRSFHTSGIRKRFAQSSITHAGNKILKTLASRRGDKAIDEDPSTRLASKHIFAKMLIEAADHPFFKRVWLARHVLDENSPILKHRVRRLIRNNDGFWPERLNSHQDIRGSLRFNQILVSLNGVSNVSASDVYAQKIYDFVDINVGYQFVNILYKDGDDGTLGVDTDLLNDVREQQGGGGEPLFDE
jgi:hypothetical protein